MLEKIRLKFNEIKEKYQQHKREVFLIFLLILFSSLSFGLGFLYYEQFYSKAPIIIEKCSTFNNWIKEIDEKNEN